MKIRVLSWFLTLGLSLCVTSSSWAQDAGLRRLDTGEQGGDFSAVGRMEIGGRGFCTGALIAPDLVLTAAHCLYDRNTGALHDLDQIEFRAGWRNGRAEAYRQVRRAVAHPQYRYGDDALIERVQYDLALLQLHHPIRNTKVSPFETTTTLRKGSKIGVVSYAVGREEAPSFQEKCRVLGRQRGIHILSCDIDFGSSGAPIFVFDGDEIRIGSVVSAKAEMKGQKVALGTSLNHTLDELRAVMTAGIEGTQTAKVRQMTPLEQRNSTGAKFVRANGG